jgi:hypothetical protein
MEHTLEDSMFCFDGQLQSLTSADDVAVLEKLEKRFARL